MQTLALGLRVLPQDVAAVARPVQRATDTPVVVLRTKANFVASGEADGRNPRRIRPAGDLPAELPDQGEPFELDSGTLVAVATVWAQPVDERVGKRLGGFEWYQMTRALQDLQSRSLYRIGKFA